MVTTDMFLAQSYADIALDAILISLTVPLGIVVYLPGFVQPILMLE